MEQPTPEQQKDAERLRRYIEREQLRSTMNATKWRETIAVLAAIPDFTVHFRVKTLREEPPDPSYWDGGFPLHIPPPLSIEWLDVDPIQHTWRGVLLDDLQTDRSIDVIRALQTVGVPISREPDAIRIWGYLRPGSNPTFIEP